MKGNDRDQHRRLDAAVEGLFEARLTRREFFRRATALGSGLGPGFVGFSPPGGCASGFSSSPRGPSGVRSRCVGPLSRS